jgi:hypothetical protein
MYGRQRQSESFREGINLRLPPGTEPGFLCRPARQVGYRDVACIESCEDRTQCRHHTSFRHPNCIYRYMHTHVYIPQRLLCSWLHGAESFLRSLQVCRQSRNSPHFTEPEVSLPQSQVPPTCPCPEPAWSNPYSTSQFLKIHLNIILPSTPGSPKWPLSFNFPHQNPVYASPLTHTRYMPRPSRSSRFYYPNDISIATTLLGMLDCEDEGNRTLRNFCNRLPLDKV